MPIKPLLKPSELSLRQFYERRNKILIIRESRGIGDILMHRMIFEDFKGVMPEAYIVFACKKEYHSVMQKHPFVDKVIDISEIDYSEYLISYNTSRCCIAYESKKLRDIDKHRSDIWAEYCGVILTKHNPYPHFLPQSNYMKQKIDKLKGLNGFTNKSPSLYFSPIAYEILRSLTHKQMKGIVEYLHKKKIFVYTSHKNQIGTLNSLKIPFFVDQSIEDWLALISVADYVISVDTATFHYAGMLKKPLTGIFTYIDGKYRGKYYDFILVQKHRDQGDWPCKGPCYNWTVCNHPKCVTPGPIEEPKPCVTELTLDEIITGIEKMFSRWPMKE